MSRPQAALTELVALLRADQTLISNQVVDSDADPALGRLAAAGPRAVHAPGEYALLVEAIREGYLLHYGESRLIDGVDPDLALLAGDYLYAIGLERLAGLGDLEAVRELSDLISLSAQVNDGGDQRRDLAQALWLASAVAVGGGRGERHEAAKRAVRNGDSEAAGELRRGALEGAEQASSRAELEAACDAIGFPAEDLSELG